MATQARDQAGDVTATVKEHLVELGTEMRELVEERVAAPTERLKEIDIILPAMEKSIAKLEDLQKQSEAYHTPGLEVGKGEPGKISIARACKAIALTAKGVKGVWDRKEFGLEGEYFDGMRDKLITGKIKTYSGSTDALGGHLIGTDIQSGILDFIRDQSQIYAAGARRMDGLTSNIAWNKMATGATAYWIDTEGEEAITESNGTYEQINARPHPLAALSKISWGMMNQPAEAVDSAITQELAGVIALEEGTAAFTGTGADGQPRGILNSGISTHADTIGGFDTAQALGTAAGVASILTGFRGPLQTLRTASTLGLPGAKMSWVVEDAVAQDIEEATDLDGRPLFLNNDQGLAESLFRIPMLVNVNSTFAGTATDRSVLVGDFNQVVVPHWGAMELSATETADGDFERGRMTFRIITALDVAVLQKTSMVEMTGYIDV